MIGIFGDAASGLAGTPSFAKNRGTARIGARGEQRTAAVLDTFGDRALVLHDLRIPLPGVKANIDHAVVSGRHVLLIDSKMWKPGFYWTWGGTPRRGLEAVPHVGKKTMQMALDATTSHLQGTGAKMPKPLVAVWPSNDARTLSMHFLRVPGAKPVKAETLARRVDAFLGTRQEADDRIGLTMMKLLNATPAPAAQPRAA